MCKQKSVGRVYVCVSCSRGSEIRFCLDLGRDSQFCLVHFILRSAKHTHKFHELWYGVVTMGWWQYGGDNCVCVCWVFVCLYCQIIYNVVWFYVWIGRTFCSVNHISYIYHEDIYMFICMFDSMTDLPSRPIYSNITFSRLWLSTELTWILSFSAELIIIISLITA